MDSAELQTFYSRPLEAILSDSRGPEAHAALLEALEREAEEEDDLE